MPGRVCVKASVDLDLSMYPSFVSSYYHRVSRERWKRLLPPRHEVYSEGNRLCCEGNGCTVELLEAIAGYWCMEGCLRGLSSAPEPARLTVSKLLAHYPGLTVSASPPGDELLVAMAVVLSRRTSYAWNVRRWMEAILTEWPNIERMAEKSARLPSPQPRLLATLLPALADILAKGCTSPWSLRRRLLSLKGVGPKTADAILLFTGCTSAVAPPDVHLSRFVERVLGESATKIPSKGWCLRASACIECPYAHECLEGRIVSLFKGAAGLVQTLAYVYDTLGLDSWRKRLERVLGRFYTSSGGILPGS